MMKQFIGISSVAIGISIGSVPAMAQVAADAAASPADEDRHRVEEIIVTATKNARAESLQKVPISITAVTPRTIADLQITNLMDIARLAPNVQFGQVGTLGAFPNFTIRGIGINSSIRTVDPAVTVSLDGMPLAFQVGVILDTFDLGSVEILRGPQGVLQGRNSTGGAVNIQTRRPSDVFEMEAAARIGNSGRLDQSFLIGGPVSETLKAKLAVLHRATDGFNHSDPGQFIPSTFNPSGQPTGNGRDEIRQNDWIVRPVVSWEPIEDLSLTLIGEYTHMNDGGLQARLANPTAQLTGATGYGYTPAKFGNSINQDGDNFNKIRARRLVLEGTWDLGVGVLTSISGYRRAKQRAFVDNDGTPFLLQSTGTVDSGKQYSQEVRFASDFSEKFRFVAGGYYSSLDMYNLIQLLRGNTVNNSRFNQQGISFFENKTYAFFGNVDLTLVDNLTLSAGVRYTHDKKNLNGTIFSNCTTLTFAGCPSAFTQVGKTNNNFSPRFGVNYQLSPTILAYASYTKGFRAAAFNNRPSGVAGFAPANPEYAKAIEAGLKTTFWDRRVRLNFSVFQTKYTDIQRVLTITGGPQTVLNAADATIRGFEAEGALRPADGLQFDSAIGYTHARFDSFPLSSTFTAIPVDDLRFDRVPEWTATFGASYEFAVGSNGKVNLRSSYSYRSSQFADVQNSPTLKLGGYGVWDGSISYSPSERWRVLFYGRNLTNKNYWDIATHNVTPTYNIGDVFTGGDPRSYGVEVSFKF